MSKNYDIDAGRRVVSIQNSATPLQAVVDYVRSLGCRDDEIRRLGVHSAPGGVLGLAPCSFRGDHVRRHALVRHSRAVGSRNGIAVRMQVVLRCRDGFVTRRLRASSRVPDSRKRLWPQCRGSRTPVECLCLAIRARRTTVGRAGLRWRPPVNGRFDPSVSLGPGTTTQLRPSRPRQALVRARHGMHA